jgi:hypothetical protein
MAVIIGSATIVNVQFVGGMTVSEGFKSIEWSYSSNVQRLYALGGGSSDCGVNEYAQIRGADVSISFSIYGGITPEVSTCAPAVCQNSPCSAIVNIIPASCGVQIQPINEQVFFNSYSYSKDRNGPGVETWAGTAYIECDQSELGPNQHCECVPTYVILGLAEGTLEGEPDMSYTELENITGARFRTISSPISTTKGSVQEGNLSLGEYSKTWYGTFRSVGNSMGWGCGSSGRANVSLALQPVYFGT